MEFYLITDGADRALVDVVVSKYWEYGIVLNLGCVFKMPEWMCWHTPVHNTNNLTLISQVEFVNTGFFDMPRDPRISTMQMFAGAGDEVEELEKITSAPSAPTGFMLGPHLIHDSMPTSITEAERRHFKLPATRKSKMMPAKDENFSVGKLKSFLRMSNCDIEIGESSGALQGDHVEIPVHLVDGRRVGAADDRLNPYVRTQLSRDQMVHVGPIELNVRGLASRNSDMQIGAVLLDTRHISNKNAVLGGALVQAANNDQRVLFYPASRIALSPNINSNLVVVAHSDNSDMEDRDVSAIFEAQACSEIFGNKHDSHPTKGTLTQQLADGVLAANYKRSNCKVISYRPEIVAEFKDMQVPLPRAMSMRATSEGDFVLDSRGRRSVSITTRGKSPTHQMVRGKEPEKVFLNTNKKKNKHVYRDSDSSSMEGPAINLFNAVEPWKNVLSNGKFEITADTVKHKQLMNVSLTRILLGGGPAAYQLRRTMKTCNKIRVDFSLCGSSMSGVGLIAAFVDGLVKPTYVDQLASSQCTMLNPCKEGSHSLIFDPSFGDDWNPQFSMDRDAAFCVMALSGWSNPPKSSLWVEYCVSIAEETCNMKRHVLGTKFDKLFGRWLGFATFPQDHTINVCRFPLALGNPTVVSKTGVHSSSLSTILAMGANFTGTIVVEMVGCSSKLIGASLAVALCFGREAWNLEVEKFREMPYQRVDVLGQTLQLEFDITDIGFRPSTMTTDLKGIEKSPLVLAIWNLTGATGTIEGDLHLALRVHEMRDVEIYGQPFSLVRNVSLLQNTQWFPFFELAEATKKAFTGSIAIEFDPYHPATIKFGFSAEKSIFIINQITNLLHGASALAGTIEYCFKWVGRTSVEIGKQKNVVCFSFFINEEGGAASNIRKNFNGKTGECIIPVDLHGPFGGMRYQNSYISGQHNKGKILISIENADEVYSFYACARIVNIQFCAPNAGLLWPISSMIV